MKTMHTLFVAGILSVSALWASPAAADQGQIMTDVAGTVHIKQHVPCNDLVDVTTSIAQGRMEMTPHVTRDGVFFDLTRLDLFVTPFSVERACLGIHAVARFSEIGISLAGAVRFQGRAIPPTSGGSRVYRFSIPKKSFLIFESVRDNLRVRQPETAYQRPRKFVTGTIELMDTERGVVIKGVQLHVALQTQLHFQAGCVPGVPCSIDEIDSGSQTADVVTGALREGGGKASR